MAAFLGRAVAVTAAAAVSGGALRRLLISRGLTTVAGGSEQYQVRRTRILPLIIILFIF
jgi:hypothetical protein